MLKRTFVHRGALHSNPTSISFSMYSVDEIKQMSVVQVITPMAFNSLGHPLRQGLYDPRMGPHNVHGVCETCQETLLHCPGHFGYIELPLPVINPLFTKTLLSIFRLSCLVCHAITLPENVKQVSICQLSLLARGLMQDAQEISEGNWTDDVKNDILQKMLVFDDLTGTLPPEQVDQIATTGTRNVENVRRLILRHILSLAKASKKCVQCGTSCRKMMLYESKLVYTLVGSGGGRNDDFFDGDDDDDDGEGGRGGRTARKSRGAFRDKSLKEQYLTPLEARDHLRLVWLKEKEFLVSLFPFLGTTTDACPTDLLFVEVVAVPPPKNRPAQSVNNMMVEHPQNLALRNVVSSRSMMIYALQAIKEGLESLSPEAMRALKGVNGSSLNDKLETVWNELQRDVDHVMDRDKGSLGAAAVGQLMGLKQVIEKKEGLFRMHMMGKRVNHAARTVITPDPNIHIEEIGIPDVFAKVLTVPVPVTPWNVQLLRQLVINGPNVHPGAVSVENEIGQVSRLDPNKENQRIGIAKRLLVADHANLNKTFNGIKTVYRHLQNGDMLLLNRQPSLHRPSIMAHRARVLHGEKVFRLHYANCKHYNADFDGDEMNAHLPQSLIAKSEAATFVNVCSNFLVPKDGTPLGGLIQDHIVAAVKLTVRGRFFNYGDYQQLVYFALCTSTKPIITLPPTIIKPRRLWSGKQVVSTIIINLVPQKNYPPTFYSAAKIKPEEWKRSKLEKESAVLSPDDKGLIHLSESSVVFRHGHLVTGVLDKVQLGATQYGLCHAFYELYGNRAVGDLLSAFSKLMTNFLQWEGFTLGVKDVLVKANADKERRAVMVAAAKVGPAAAAAGVGLQVVIDESNEGLLEEKLEQSHRSPDPKARAIVDQAYKQHLDQYTNQINRSCLPFGLVATFPENNLQLLVQSGAKGSTVNTMQMSCLLGQIELEGKRPHLTMSGKSLPSFKRYDVTPRAGGFIAGRFLTGIRPQEFFFHCMAGREGLIDTAVKTSRSGYLQRCLVKLLEGLVTQYDGTVRDSDGSIIQFLYGEDGLDVGLSQYLKPKLLDFLRINSHIILKSDAVEKVKELGKQKKIRSAKKNLQKWKDTNKVKLFGEKKRQSPALAYFQNLSKSEIARLPQVPEDERTPGRSQEAVNVIQAWRNLSSAQKEKFTTKHSRCPDPILSYLKPESNFGVVSEYLESHLEGCDEDLKNVVYFKALKALSCPGDAVGVLAAQSIGEPSTQMTLNTFHFAGRGEMNVTLGIPRLREILMVASENIRTPSMDIPFKPHVSARKAEQLRLKLVRVTLAQVLQHVTIKETISQISSSRLFTITFQFLQEADYAHQFYIRPSIILKYFEKYFIHQHLCPAFRKVTNLSKSSGSSIGTFSRGRKGKQSQDDGGGVDDGGANEEATKDLYEEMEKHGMGEDHQSSDEEPDLEDEDATQSTRKARQTEREYEEPDDEAQDNGDDEDPDGYDEEARLAKKTKSKRIEDDDEVDDDNEDKGPNRNQIDDDNDDTRIIDERTYTVSAGNYENRIATVVALDDLICDYEFDRVAEEHCAITLKVPLTVERANLSNVLKEEADRAVIHQIKHIKRAFIVEQNEKKILKTEGINILAMTDFHELLDLSQLYCNNIHTMAQHYGVEASSRVIVKEMTDVFKAYGITLDSRHLTLIADFMTFSGTYRAFSRIGIESSPSPLQQMSFETVVTFLRDAILGGRKDELKNPSARLVLGKPAQSGTGLFGVMTQLRI